MKRVLIVLLVVLVVVLGGAWLYLDRIAQVAVQRAGTGALGVPVEVESMALSPFSGRLGMDRFRVANPEGFSDEPMFRLEQGQVGVRLGSLLSDVIDIPEIALDGLHVRVERTKSGTNLKRMLDHLGGDGEAASEPREGGDTGPGKRVRVDYLRIAEAGATVDLGPEFGERGRFELALPTIEMRDLGKENGITVEALIERVTRAVVARIEQAGADQLPDRIRRELRQRLDRETEALEREVDAVEQKAEEAVKEKEKDIRKKLEDEASKLLE